MDVELDAASVTTTASSDVRGAKRSRGESGFPDPEVEVIALSPRSLMLTNRFVCEVCGKGFQREQNLQLHRRGHNLPWKLRQRTPPPPPPPQEGGEGGLQPVPVQQQPRARKRVYVCPEESCVHHNPARALGDLTGIKKHFCRKHGEKKLRCERCTRTYAVQSDLRAHLKVCGSRQYRCSCGTLFSRKDSYVTHQSFCAALAKESAMGPSSATKTIAELPKNAGDAEEQPGPDSVEDPSGLVRDLPQTGELGAPAPKLADGHQHISSATVAAVESDNTDVDVDVDVNANTNNVNSYNSSNNSDTLCRSTAATNSSTFAGLFVSIPASVEPQRGTANISDLIVSCNEGAAALGVDPLALCLFPPLPTPRERRPLPSPHMSATALLQKAAEVGATTSGSTSYLVGLGLSPSDSPAPRQRLPEYDARLALGLPYESIGGQFQSDFVMGTSSNLVTFDFLGLGVGPSLLSSLGTAPISMRTVPQMPQALFGEGSSRVENTWDETRVNPTDPRFL